MRLLLTIPAAFALFFGIGQLPPEWEHDIERLPITEPLVPATTVYTPPPTTIPVTAPTPVTAAPATTTTLVVSDTDAEGPRLCGEWWPTARSMGWPEELLPTLDRVMWNESRCQPDVVSATGDHGLVQVNWSTWAPLVESLGYGKQHLYTPAVNLLIGRLIYQAALDAGWCGFDPWKSSGNYCN
jgi:hypothetical protein